LAGIYIHIPFCKQACSYCNFHFSVSLANKTKMVAAIVQEILLPNDVIRTTEIETIYFGGGTPSLLDTQDLDAIFTALNQKFTIAKNAEITIEANPDDINPTVLQQWKTFGINRLSVGLQSFDEAELKWMNRAHNATQSLQCIDDIQAAGFTNFSVDLIYGSPLQSNEILQKNLEIIAAKNIPHISCYALTVEENTVLSKAIKTKKSPAVQEEIQSEQFQLLLQLMEANGYEQYEISSFCKSSYASKHNSSYWQGKPYYGFGPSAHSYNGLGVRRWNIANNSLYIQALEKNIIPYEEEILTPTQQINEYIMTAIRTNAGIDMEKVKMDFGVNVAENIISKSNKFLETDKIIVADKNIYLTKKGKFFADGIAADLFMD
jgi:oxygen-independent coproporphyrinogen III oxidase